MKLAVLHHKLVVSNRVLGGPRRLRAGGDLFLCSVWIVAYSKSDRHKWCSFF